MPDFSVATIEFYTVAIPAVVLLGFSKGGFSGVGLLSLPLMALVMPPLQAASIMLPILLIQNGVGAWAYRRSWNGRNLLILLPSAVVGTAAGYLLAAKVSQAAVEVAVGLISITFGLFQMLPKELDRGGPAARPRLLLGVVSGSLAGFINMIAQAGIPPILMYLIPQRLERDVFVGTVAIFFAAITLMRVPAFMALGWFTEANLIAAATLVPVAVLSTWAGVLLVRSLAGPVFFSIVYGLLILVGIKLAWDGYAAL